MNNALFFYKLFNSLPMKKSTKVSAISSIYLALLVFGSTLFNSVKLYAQSVPDKVDVDINTNEGTWYGEPWVWVVGVAVFIVIIIAITRGNRNSA